MRVSYRGVSITRRPPGRRIRWISLRVWSGSREVLDDVEEHADVYRRRRQPDILQGRGATFSPGPRRVAAPGFIGIHAAHRSSPRRARRPVRTPGSCRSRPSRRVPGNSSPSATSTCNPRTWHFSLSARRGLTATGSKLGSYCPLRNPVDIGLLTRAHVRRPPRLHRTISPACAVPAGCTILTSSSRTGCRGRGLTLGLPRLCSSKVLAF